MRILITRPANLAKGLAEKINTMGDIPELFPTIEIKKTSHQEKLKAAIENLDKQNIAIFVSQSAVEFSMSVIKTRWPILPNILWAAIGPSTANALKKFGIQHILIPDAPPYESESLLAHPQFQSVHGKYITIFRGNGGRELLSETLNTRGAIINLIEVYQRALPKPNQNQLERINHWHHTPIDIIITTSAACLNNLLQMVDNKGITDIPIIVVGSRMLELAKELKFKHPIIATDADDASIIKVLKTFKDNRV